MRKLDELVARIERALILVCVAGMTLLVGADVVQRTFSRPVGKTEQLVVFVAERVLGPLDANARSLCEGVIGDGVFVAFAVVVLSFATHSSRRITAERAQRAEPGVAGSVLTAGGLFLVSAAAVKALLWLFPSSVPGAQRFALGLMLWAGMLGASIATKQRRHIALDAVTKKLDEKSKRLFALLSGAATATFCGFLALLSTMQLVGEVRDWWTFDGVGLYEALPIPTWIATLALPATFITMAARFLGYGVRDFIYGPPVIAIEGLSATAAAQEEAQGGDA